MGNVNFGGLASGLDTNSIIQQLIAIETRPIQLVNNQRTDLQNQASAIKDLNTRLSALENAAFSLTQFSSVLSNSAESSDSDVLLATANSNASAGSYQVDVLRLATSTILSTGTGAGQGNTLGALADITDFSGETIDQINANNRLSEDISVGTFAVNGQNVTINGSDTLNDVFAKISTATGGAVTGALVTDAASNGLVVELSSASTITLANGTSNFLSTLNLDTASYSGGTLRSSSAVNAIQSNLKLDGSDGSANLAQAVGSGILTINGQDIAYDEANDSIGDIIKRINDANIGVRASFSSINGGRVSLKSDDKGPLNIQLTDSGNLVNALGLAATDSANLGQSAQISVDGGPVQSFNSNSGITAAGLDGVILDLRKADPGNAVNVEVTADTDSAVSNVQNFVDQYNSVVAKIDELTAFDRETGNRGILISDFTVGAVRNRLRSLLFDRVSGLAGGAEANLAEVGLSTGAVGATPGTTNALQLDASKLREAIQDNPSRVAQLFGIEEAPSGSKGIFERFKGYLDELSNSTGIFAQKSKNLQQRIDSLDSRIDILNARLLTRQEQLEKQFTSLERTISTLQAQQSSLLSLFSG